METAALQHGRKEDKAGLDKHTEYAIERDYWVFIINAYHSLLSDVDRIIS